MWGLHGNDTEVKFMLEQLPQRHKEANDPWRRTTAPARVSTGRNTTRPTFLLVVSLISLYIIHTSLRHLKAAAAVTGTNTTVPVAAATNGATAVAVFFTCITDQSEIHPLPEREYTGFMKPIHLHPSDERGFVSQVHNLTSDIRPTLVYSWFKSTLHLLLTRQLNHSLLCSLSCWVSFLSQHSLN